ncbi:MAG: FxsA family protein [Microthrixaceae bacterium]
MVPVLLALLLVLPFVEIWAALAVASWIGGLPTFVLLVAMSASGVWVLRRQGANVWRRANAELAAGRAPTGPLLDGVLVLVGGSLLVVPGFVTGVVGIVLLLPPVRALLRPAMLAWMTRRAAKAATSGRLRGVFVNTTVGADGRVHQRATRFGEVIDSDGWDVTPGSGPAAGTTLPPSSPPPSTWEHRGGRPPGVIDVDGTDADGDR